MQDTDVQELIKKVNTLSAKKQRGLVSLLKKQGIDISAHISIQKRPQGKGDELLSFAQQRLWFLSKLEGNSSHYNIPLALRLMGPLNCSALVHSIETVVDRHAVLRTRFEEIDGIAYQTIDEEGAFCVREEASSSDADLQALCRDEANIPFDLGVDRLIRARLIRIDKNDHVLMVTMHHSVSDGWSMGVFFREMAQLYHAYSADLPFPLTPLPIQYADFSHWQRQWFTDDVLQQQLQYWEKQLFGLPSLLTLPNDHPRPKEKSYRGAEQKIHVPPAVLARLNALGQREGATLYMILLSGFAVLLSRYSGQSDIAVGSPIANRNRPEIENLIGFFVNTLVLRINTEDNPRFTDLLAQVKATALKAYAHQDVPFESVVDAVKPARSLSFSPLFQVMFILQNNPRMELPSSELRVNPLGNDLAIAKFDLTLALQEAEDGLCGSVEYSTDLFEKSTVERFIGNYTRLLEAIAAAPQGRIVDYDLLSEQERHQLLIEWNDTQVDFPRDECLHELFEAQVQRNPKAIALVFEGERLTYKKLNQCANQVAHYLHAQGVKPDTLVGVCIERSLEMVIGVLGILKAGGAYVPIDPDYPQERIGYMLEDSGVAIVLTQSSLQEKLPETGQKFIYLDTDSNNLGSEKILSTQPTNNLDKESLQLTPKNLAYVIYTSGSTGRPKGVLLEHSNATAFISWAIKTFAKSELNSVLASTTLSFDLSVYEIFAPLAIGGRIVIVNDILDLISNPPDQDISLINTVPSAIRALANAKKIPESIHTINLAGEPLRKDLVDLIVKETGLENIYNLYGPTEYTTYTTIFKVDPNSQSEPLIGRPIANTSLFVLDPNNNVVPIGVVGELCIGGAGLVRGYLNKDTLTREKFISNPFYDAANPKSSERLYKTGDLVRWLADGNVEFIGRVDDQIKLRGYRIELGEIESQLAQHDFIESSVVVVQEESGDKRLIAYVVLAVVNQTNDGNVDTDIASFCRTHLQQTLPEYMIPSAYMVLDSMPLTPNGKIDKQALPAPDSKAYTQVVYVAAETETEQVLLEVWSDLLQLPVEEISTGANFFSLGGHSLLIVQMIACLQQRGLGADVRQVFSATTLAALAQSIDGSTDTDLFTAPPNLIPEGCDVITPEMLPLVALGEDDIAFIASQVPGGVANIQDIYPLAPLQEGILFHHLLHPERDPYVLPVLLAIADRKRLDTYLNSLQTVIDRHDVLRTAVISKGVSRAVQVVYRQANLMIESITLRSDQAVDVQLQALLVSPQLMDLTIAPLLQIKIIQDPHSSKWYVLQCLHHIVADHIGAEIITTEVLALLNDRGGDLLPSVPYREFVAHALQQAQTYDAKAFFSERLSDITEPTLPFQLRNIYGDGSHIGTAHRRLAPSLAQEIRDQARQLNVSPAVLFHTAWAVVVAVCSDRDDVVFGTLFSGRLQGTVGVERMLGMFINTLPLRVTLRDKTVKELVLNMDTALKELVRYEQASLTLAQRCSGVVGDAPLFSALLNYRHNTASRLTKEESVQSPSGIQILNAKERTNYPFCLSVNDQGEGFSLDAQIDASVSAERVLDYVECAITNLVKALSSPAEQRVSHLNVLPAAERQQLLVDWNNTQADYPSDKCVHELFEAQVEENPKAVAVTFEDQHLTYEELSRKANQVAHYLVEQGVKPDTLVGLCVERSIEMLVGLLGILKAGGAYVPIDPDYPEERIRYMLEDSGVEIVLTQTFLSEQLPVTQKICLYLNADSNNRGETNIFANQPISNLAAISLPLTPNHLAYLIYTSGSTGLPKGVMIEHKGLCNTLLDNSKQFGVDHHCVFIQSTSISFDAATWVIGMVLTRGANLVLVKDLNTAPEQIKRIVSSTAATHIMMTPSALDALVASEFPSLDTVVVGGDQCHADLLERWSNNVSFFNAYGPTEASICVATGKQYPDRPINIGKPIANTEIFLLNQQHQLVPIGVTGELYVSGVGLARGYLNVETLTEEKFIPNPFSADPNDRLYRTGDIARWLWDGNLEFIGRVDDQVKLRGYRIELGEIECHLVRHDLIQSCVLVMREDAGDKRLVAYLVLHDKVDGDIANILRTHLQHVLPEYMIPSAYVVLDSLPLTPNGKVNKKVLPSPDSEAFEQVAYVAPANELEKIVVEIWSELLQLPAENISTTANFFTLGGHSLLATQLVNHIHTRTGLSLPLLSVFDGPSVQQLALALHQHSPGADQLPVITVDNSSPIPLSFAQQRLWFLAQLEGVNEHYNIPLALRFRGPLNRESLVKSILAIVDRHDVLRSRFVDTEGVAYQVIDESGTFKVVEDTIKEETLLSVCKAEARSPFDLSRDRLMRAQLLRINDTDHVLLVTLHHSVSDGWSMTIFFRELAQLYHAYCEGQPSPLPPLPIQYADFAHWQRRWLTEDVLQTQLRYWQQQLAGLPPLLALPTYHPRPSVKTYNGAHQPVRLPSTLLKQLNVLSEQEDVTLYMVLLASFAILLNRYSGQQDIAIGSPIANRNRPEIENLIGFFVNTLVLRVNTEADLPFVDMLAQVKNTALDAYVHQDIPFETIVDAVQPARSLSYSPLFQVMLTLQNNPRVDMPSSDVTITPIGTDAAIAKFDLTMNLHEMADGLHGSVEYNTDLFEPSTIERFIGHYTRLLEAIVADPQARVSRYNLLSEQERHKLLIGWNTTNADFPQDKCLHELFEAQVEQHPNNIALVFNDQTLTYEQLNQRANQVAHYLHAQGLTPDTLVGLCVERSLEMVIGLLGILKAGGAYVPIDPSYPEERIKYMLIDSGVEIVLSQSHLQDFLPRSKKQKWFYLDTKEEGSGHIHLLTSELAVNIDKKAVNLTQQNLAYVIYTSGSTGKPKGVMVEHGGWVNLALSQSSLFAVDASSRCLQFSSLSFDAAASEIAMALTQGAALHLLSENECRSPKLLCNVLNANKISHATLPPALLTQLSPKKLTSASTLIVAGESISANQAVLWSQNRDLFNAYGPTEITVCATAGKQSSEHVNIGTPINNTKIYILNKNNELLPIGIPGELCVSGVGIARGYLNKEELTQEKFISNPFYDTSDLPSSERLYKTGDLARWLEDGNIEFIGRIDDQIKLRGYRIEPSEIETQLLQQDFIESCVVIVREDESGDKRLVAYVILSEQQDTEVGGADIAGKCRTSLLQNLPEYMIPGAYVVIDALPLTPSRKIDKNALPAPSSEAFTQVTYVAPANETEHILVEVWSDILQLPAEDISTHANFFALGGHSLLIVQMIARLQQQGLNTDVRQVFGSDNLAGLAQEISMSSVDNVFIAQPNGIPEQCDDITPEMLSLVSLSEADIAVITAQVPGGASNIQDIYPLAPLQEGILFHHLLQPKQDPYVLPVLFSIDNRKQLDAFVSGLQAVVDRHDVLRTAVITRDVSRPVQVVYREAEIVIDSLELCSDKEVEAQLRELVASPQIIELNRAPLLRVKIVRDPNSPTWYLLQTLHHIATDHVGLEIIIAEVVALLGGRGDSLPSPVPYREFVAHTLHQAQTFDGVTYFKQQLGDVEEPTLPFKLQNVYGDGSQIETAHRGLTPELAKGIRHQARQLNVSPAALFHLAWAVVVGACSGRDDVVFGTLLSGRLQGTVGADRMLGMFINTLPLRITLHDKTVRNLLVETHLALKELVHYEQFSLSLAQRCSGIESDGPLFSALLNYRHNTVSQKLRDDAVQALSGIRVLSAQERTNYPFGLSVNDQGELFSLDAQIDASISAERVLDYVESAITCLVEALSSKFDISVLSLNILSAPEQRQLMDEWNNTQADYPQEKCIHELFEAQVEQYPKRVAVIFENQQLTYEELNQKANQVAHYLHSQGVRPDALVGLCVERSLEMVIGLLGVLKAGGAYVPIDPNYPQERINYMLRDSGIEIVLSQSYLQDKMLRLESQRWVYLDCDGEMQGAARKEKTNIFSNQSIGNLPKDELTLTPQHLAYVIYTSGSTGQPKGVLLEHRNVTAFITWAITAFTNEELSSVLASTTLSFDLSIYEIFAPLAIGGRLIVVKDILDLVSNPPSQSISLINTVPSAIKALANAKKIPESVRTINLAGEPLRNDLVRTIIKESGQKNINNLYGPTEYTTYTTYFKVDTKARSEPLIGRPIANTNLYIVDANNKLVPIGVIGELCVGGAGLVRGYLNNDALTQEKFIPNPFYDAGDSKSSERLYKTGDLARWLPDGNVEFIGRADDQVKIRGYRIELGEIESQLLQHKIIQSCVVMARDDAGGKRLVAYLTLTTDCEDGLAGTLRTYLQQFLPEYMIPSAFVVLDALPLTPNGKVDKKALPAPDSESFAQVIYVAPTNEIEQTLVEIWSELLQLPADEISTKANFFTLGGHSLLATQLVNHIYARTGNNLPLRAVFDGPTVQQLALVLSQQQPSIDHLPLVAVDRSAPIPLSFAQQRLWFLAQFEGSNAHYNMPLALRFQGPLNRAALIRSIETIVDRHDVLRTRFVDTEGLAYQVIDETGTFKLVEDSIKEETLLSVCKTEACAPFDLSRDCLIRAHLLWINDTDHVLLVTMHHSVSDGWSMNIFFRELTQLYNAYCQHQPSPLPPLPIQYVDFAHWQRQWLTGEVLQDQLQYWQHQLAGLPPVLALPTDHPRPSVATYNGAHQPIHLSPTLVKQLNALSEQEGVTLYMLLLTSFAVLLSRYSGQNDLAIGSPIANRNRPEVEQLIGFFVNTLVLRVNTEDNPQFIDVLAQVKVTALEAYAHQDIPFETIVDAVQPERSLSYSPLFQAMFTLQNTQHMELPSSELRVSKIANGLAISKFDLSMAFHETPDGLQGSVEYRTDLFEPSTIERLIGHFERLLQAMVAAPHTRISSYEMLSEQERELLLVKWNNTQADYPHDKCLHELFEAQVEKNPYAIALVFEEQQLTYEQLNRNANQVAHYLRAQDVRLGSLVGLCVERSLDVFVGILGILKAGAAYVPIDPNYPEERIRYILDDSNVGIVISQLHLQDKFLHSDKQMCVYLDRDDNREGIASKSTNNITREQYHITTEHLAYVIYTSGSTGKPKGVMISHQNVSNLLSELKIKWEFSSKDNFLALTTIAFDMAVPELYLSLVNGARVTLTSQASTVDGEALSKILDEEQVTIFQATPSTWRLLLDSGWSGNHNLKGICGGEELPVNLAEQIIQRVGKLWNMYGPTETTVWSTFFPMTTAQQSGSVSIGRPIGNTQIYILSVQHEVVPIGVPGELYIGGVQLGRGYVNIPELTEVTFIANPFYDLTNPNSSERLYKTGDLGRWLSDGNIEYLGRLDDQVKIRGFRIELGEIESQLLQHVSVDRCVVLAWESPDTGEKQLVAYVFLIGDDKLLNSSNAQPILKKHLNEMLPEYMVPSAYVILDEVPLTPNGKVDRKSLPAPGRESYALHEYVPPNTKIERLLVLIWAELLQFSSEEISVTANFFTIGGNSLLSVRLLNKINQELGSNITVQDLFTRPTIRSLASITHAAYFPQAPQYTILIKMREGSKKPLFIFHEVTGRVFPYLEIIRKVDDDVPIYFFQYENVEGQTLSRMSMRRLAAKYIDLLRGIDPQGPYRLLGWSLGGLIAYEIGYQLLGENQQVDFLGLIDSVNPARSSNFTRDENEESWDKLKWLQFFVKSIHKSLSTELQEKLLSIGDLETAVDYCHSMALLPKEYQLSDIDNTITNLIKLSELVAGYIPQPISCPVSLFKATETDAINPSLGWSNLINDNWITYDIPGSHGSIMESQSATELAALISKDLKTTKPPVAGKSLYSPLVALQHGQKQSVGLFCVPGAGASVSAFIPLTKLIDKNFPVYGLQPRGIDGDQVPHSSVEAAAEDYIQAMCKILPGGSYYLLGHSFGGWIAFEIACRLQQRGIPVKTLILVDTQVPSSRDSEPTDYSDTESILKLVEIYGRISDKNLHLTKESSSGLGYEDQLQALMRGMQRIDILPSGNQLSAIRSLVRVFSVHLNTNYVTPLRFSGEIMKILPKDTLTDSSDNSSKRHNNWLNYASKVLEVKCNGNHMTVLNENNFKPLADRINRLLLNEE